VLLVVGLSKISQIDWSVFEDINSILLHDMIDTIIDAGRCHGMYMIVK
jgi:hypothetical protein